MSNPQTQSTQANGPAGVSNNNQKQFVLQPLQPPPGYFFYNIGGQKQQDEYCSECEEQQVHQHIPGTIRRRRFSFWKNLKRYYIFAALTIAGIYVQQEMSHDFTYLYSSSKWHLDHPSVSEFFLAHVKNMGHMKDTVPEISGNLTLKEFMVNHITNYWPGVFRHVAQDMPAYEKWQSDQYLAKAAGFESVMVDTSQRGEIVPPFHPDRPRSIDMNYYKFLQKSYQFDEEGSHSFIDHITPPPRGFMPDIIEPQVTGQLLNLEEISYFQDGNTTSTRGLARSTDREMMTCALRGEVRITIVPSWERLLVYPGTAPGMPTNYSPVDFFSPNLDQHGNFRSATLFDISLRDGDCLYLPAYWWYQSQTTAEATILVTFWYTVASEWLKTIFYALETNMLDSKN